MATTKRPTMLRLHDEMYEKVRFLAYKEHRSLNAQIEYALQKYIDEYEQSNGSINIE